MNRPVPSCFEPHYESEASCNRFFIMKISFHSLVEHCTGIAEVMGSNPVQA